MFTTYAKAAVAAILGGLGALLTALGDNSISYQEMVTVAIATLTIFSAVWATPNKP
jgi:hypothetical protein